MYIEPGNSPLPPSLSYLPSTILSHPLLSLSLPFPSLSPPLSPSLYPRSRFKLVNANIFFLRLFFPSRRGKSMLTSCKLVLLEAYRGFTFPLAEILTGFLAPSCSVSSPSSSSSSISSSLVPLTTPFLAFHFLVLCHHHLSPFPPPPHPAPAPDKSLNKLRQHRPLEII